MKTAKEFCEGSDPCPFCDGDEVQAQDANWIEGEYKQTMHCVKCGRKWNEWFAQIGYTYRDDEGNYYEMVESAITLRMQRDEARKALRELFKQCVLIHKKWGQENNRQEADAAIAAARAIAEAE